MNIQRNQWLISRRHALRGIGSIGVTAGRSRLEIPSGRFTRGAHLSNRNIFVNLSGYDGNMPCLPRPPRRVRVHRKHIARPDD